MAGVIRSVLGPFVEPIIKPILRPITRVLASLIAIPLFRLFRRKVVRVQDLNDELEKDVDQWFRGAILLFLAMQYMEQYLFPWAQKHEIEFEGEVIRLNWITLGLRLMLAMGVIEGMPDQTLFSLIHPGLRRVKLDRSLGVVRGLIAQWKNVVLGFVCHHLNRSSPVFAILSTIYPGKLGLVFYGLAITQYLIIGLVTSRDRALDVLGEFDRRVAERRMELIQELSPPETQADTVEDVDL